MKKYISEELWSKYIDGSASEEEQALVERWHFMQMKDSDKLPTVEELLNANDQILACLPIIQHQKSGLVSLWPKLTGVAVVLFFTVMSILWYRGSNSNKIVFQSIPRGTNKAILSIEGQPQIILDKSSVGLVTDNDGIQVGRTRNGEVRFQNIEGRLNPKSKKNSIVSVNTPRGGRYCVVLADGTKVWLNASSEISFPLAFTDHERSVKIKGEAYFEVSSEKSRPFRVFVRDQVVEVLGTRFNIKGYQEEEAVKTTLLQGSVKISVVKKTEKAHNELLHSNILKPGEQSISKDGRAIIAFCGMTAARDAAGWKDSRMVFEDADLKTVMKEFSRWYDVDVEYEGQIPDLLFSGVIDQSRDASAFSEMMDFFKVKVRMEESKDGKTIIVISSK